MLILSMNLILKTAILMIWYEESESEELSKSLENSKLSSDKRVKKLEA